jgi:uncharacterized protein (DUF2252 family)
MPSDPASRLKLSKCQADFTYTMTAKAIKIQDTGKGTKPVIEDLEAVLRKIEAWHQRSITSYKISCRDTQGNEVRIDWDGQQVRIVP